MSRRIWLIIIVSVLLLVAVPLVVLALREKDSCVKGKTEGVTVRFPGEDWGYPSPFQFYPRGPGFLRMSYIFDTLTWKDENGLVGLIAESWETAEDGRSYTFRLRPGIRWHDGAILTADDVVFSYNYLAKHGYTWANLEVISEVKSHSGHEVTIHLKETCPSFLVSVAGSVPVIPKHVWEKIDDPGKFTGPDSVIGSGPFTLESYSKAHGTYSFNANPDYHLGSLKVSRLEYIVAGDPVLALKKGKLDCLTFWTRTLDAIDGFRQDQRYRIKSGLSFWVLKLMFNHKIENLSRREVRQAFAYALDLEDVVKRIRHGHARAGNPGFVPPQSPWYREPGEKYLIDLDRARAILRDAGYNDANKDGILDDEHGKPLSFTLLSAREYIREAEYISSQAGKIGIEVIVKVLPFQTLDAFLKKADYDLALNGHGGIGGDPDYLKRYFCSDDPDGPAAFQTAGGYINQDLNALAEKQRLENNPVKRRMLIHRMQEIIAQEIPVIPLWYPKIYFAYRPDVVEGWFWTLGGIGIGIPTFDNKLVYLERRLR